MVRASHAQRRQSLRYSTAIPGPFFDARLIFAIDNDVYRVLPVIFIAAPLMTFSLCLLLFAQSVCRATSLLRATYDMFYECEHVYGRAQRASAMVIRTVFTSCFRAQRTRQSAKSTEARVR